MNLKLMRCHICYLQFLATYRKNTVSKTFVLVCELVHVGVIGHQFIHNSGLAVRVMFDKKCVHLCYKYLDKVVRLCQQPKLNLKISPPYILDIIPDIYEKLQGITASYEENYDVLSQIEYFQIYISTVIEKCEQTINLFKNSKEKIFDTNSDARFRLVKLSLVYSHLLKDLEALFPHNIFTSTTFRITKPDAARWWLSNFDNSAIVSWQLFKHSLLQTFRIDSEGQLSALQTTIDITCNDYVSIFEFDVFTRLFQPWCNILETWKALAILHPGYMAFMTYDQVKTVLKRYCTHPGPGTYVFRLSCTKLGQWAIGYITQELKILQTIIQNKSLAQALVDGEKAGFYLYPNGKPNPTTLLFHLTHNLLQVHLQVTKEQYQLYCEMGSSFELCKICDENNKDTQLEPCGHLICKHCLRNCQSKGNGQTCPFCRLEIKGIEEVVVDPYKPYSTTNFKSVEPIMLCPRPLLLFENTNKTMDIPSYRSMNDLCNTMDFPSNSLVTEPPPIPPRNLCLTPKTDKKEEYECKLRSSHTTISSIGYGAEVSFFTPNSNPHTNNQEQISDPSQINNIHVQTSVSSSGDTQLSSQGEALPTSLRIDVQTSTGNINQAKDLNYTQLDLKKSESSSDFETLIPNKSNAMEDRQNNSVFTNCLPHKYSNATSCSPSNTDDDNNKGNRPTDNVITTDAPDHSIIFMTMKSVNENIEQLLSMNPEMTEDTAKLLLTITDNHINISHEIWKYFMPRV
uniref:E3 ubiquitin-protein ligase CBL n=2 Tax=Trichobilharzia regenti TaxID=157069 RepID=A0AA85KKC6_TRIRE|nr:unnamed protein product [Trichobilharzia regenti]